MPNIVTSPESGILEFNYNDPSGSATNVNTASIRLHGTGGNTFFTGTNVGIGTTTPAHQLHLNKENAISEMQISRGGSDPTTNTDIGRIQFKTDYSASPNEVGSIWVKTNSSSFRTDMRFGVKATAGTEEVGLTVHGTNDGPLVGIGTTNPQTKLHVTQGTDDNTDGIRLSRANSNASYSQYIDTSAKFNIGYSNPSTADPDPQITLEQGGNVGIGITDPDQKLHVSGNIRVGHGGASDYNRIDFTRNGGAIVGGIGWHTDNIFYIGGHPSVGPTAGRTVRVYGFGSDVRLGDSVNGDVLTVDATNGNVGIGTTSPASKLHIENTAYDFDSSPEVGDFHLMLRDFDSSTAGDAISIGFAQSTAATAVGAKLSFLTEGSFSRGSLVFSTNSTASIGDNTAERMRIASDGNVGIGTNNPQTKLTVGSDGNEDGIELREAGNLRFKVRPSSSNAYLSLYDSSANEDIRLNTAGDSYFNGGDVGIGTSNPVTQLEVQESAGAPMLQLRPNAASTDINPIILYRGQVNGAANYMLCQGVSTFFGTFEGGVPTDPSDMIKLQPNISANPQLHIGDAGSSAATLNVGGNIKLLNNGASYINGGNVGIGTVNPDFLFECRTSNTNAETVAGFGNNNINGGLEILTSDGNLAWGFNAKNSRSLVFQTNQTERMRINSAGNVGIKTTNPLGTLHIATNDATNGDLMIGGNNDPMGFACEFVSNNDTKLHIGRKHSADSEFIERVTILDEGNVGIGTSNPDGPLHIQYSDATARTSVINNTTVGLQIENSNSAGVAQIHLRAGDGDAHILVENVGANATDMFISVDGTEPALTIKDSGNVGIGTTNPIGTLHVYNTNTTSDGDGTATMNATGQDSIVLYGHGGVDQATYGGISWMGGSTRRRAMITAVAENTDTDFVGLAFYTQGTDGAGDFSESMRITRAGKVGIGTTSPSQELTISTKSASANNATLHLEVAGTNVEGFINQNNGEMQFISREDTTNGTFKFQGSNGTAFTNYMVIDADGEVGIGTNTPQEKFHVDEGFILADGASTNHGFELRRDAVDTFQIRHLDGNFTINNLTDNRKDLTIDGDGKVGIGTTNPDEALDVVGFIRMGHATANSTQKIARQVVRAYNTSHNDFIAFMGTANETSNVVSYGGGSSSQTCATKLSFFTHTNVSTSTAGTERMHINSIGKIGMGAATSFSTDHAGMRLQICAEDTSPSLDASTLDDSSLVISNEDEDYGMVFAVRGGGQGQIQQRRMTSAPNVNNYPLELQPYGGNVGIGTEDPSNKLTVNGSFSASSKTFDIEHPTQSGKRLIHGCFEGPEHGVYFRGKTQNSGIQAPEYWSGLVDIDSMTVDVTPIGPNQSIYVDRIEDNGDVYVGANTSEPLNYFYVVYGERKDIDKLEIVKDPTPPALEAHLME